MMQSRAFSQCFYDMKQKCPSLQNIQYSHKKSFRQQLDSITKRIPIMKSINKLRLEQEQKIYNNIHKVKKMNLMHEINKVNPTLYNDLRSLIKNDDQLTNKYEQYKQLFEQQQIEMLSETHDSCIKYPFDCSGVKIFNNRPLIRNIMDDFEQESSQYNNDSCINKYLDLN